MDRALFIAQRLTALALAPMVAVHLIGIIYAIHGGMTLAGILDRTKGSVSFGVFYCLFVLMAAIHSGIGLRNILTEWTSINPRVIASTMTLLVLFLIATGLRAVAAVVW
jgi:succinate dehydrogenase subunit C